MNTKKLDLGIAIIWGVSLVLGFLYNAFILPLATQNASTEHIMKYVTYLICIAGSTFFLHWFAKKMSSFGTGRMFMLMFIPLVLASIVLHYTTGMDEIMGVTFVICVFFPLFTQFIKQSIYQKHSKLKILGLMFLLIIAGLLVGGFNMFGLTAAVSILTIAISVFVYDVEKPKHWSIGLVMCPLSSRQTKKNILALCQMRLCQDRRSGISNPLLHLPKLCLKRCRYQDRLLPGHKHIRMDILCHIFLPL